MSSEKRDEAWGRPRVEELAAAEALWPVAALLGEGPAWIMTEAALRFVDIKGGRLHRFDPATGDRQSITVGGRPSFVLPADDGSLMVGDGHALRRLEHGVLEPPFATIDMPGHNRINDATVDGAGRLWFGTMDDGESRPSGAVHVYDPVLGAPRAVGGACVITNGPAVSLDGRVLYHVDTLGGIIWRFAIDGGERLEKGEQFARVAPEDGVPDGVTLDASGCLWVGLWGGWALRRYAPDGACLGAVRLPCANVTKVAFGGPDLRTGFITTARIGLSAAALAEQPLAGALFAFAAPVPGLPLPSVRIGR